MLVACELALNPDQGRVAAPYLQPLLDAAAAREVSATAIAVALGNAPTFFESLPPNLPVTDYLRMLETAAHLCGDPDFGLHAGEAVRPAAYMLLGFAVMSCSTLAQTLQQVLRYESLVHDLGRSQLVEAKNCAAFVWRHPFDEAGVGKLLADSVLAGIVTFARGLVRRALPMRHVEFAHAAPQDQREYRRIFNVPLRFGASRNAIIFDLCMLDWPVPFADASLLPILEHHAEQQLLAQQSMQSVANHVRHALVQALDRNEDCSITAVAARIGLGTRTLQRYLQREGKSFQGIFEDVRHKLAIHLLNDARLSITEIAYRLGYRQQSSFNHAFLELTGVCPSIYRQRLQIRVL